MESRAERERSVAAVTAVVTLTLAALAGVLWADPARGQETGADFVPGEVVVKLNLRGQSSPGPDYCATTIQEINRENGTSVKETLLSNPSVACIYLLQLPQGSGTEATADDIAGDTSRVTYAEPNFVTDAPEGNPRHRAAGESDPLPSADPAPYSSQYAVGAMRLSCARDVGTGANATVAVLDTGVQQDHPELAEGLTEERYDFVDDDGDPEDARNGQDEDGDGYTDEMAGHGTHVAGIVRLAAPEAKVMPLRVLDSDGTGNAFLVAEAVQYAVRNGADVVNMSLGTSRPSELVGDVADDLVADDDDDDTGPALEDVPPEGAVVVASAGNEGTEGMRYPASEAPVLAVASVGADSEKSDFSNYGGWVDVSAPGDDVHSLFPTSRYARWDGTSMAAPFVAGTAALIRDLDPNMDAATVGATITANARDINTQNANQPYSGKIGGHADAFASVKALRPNATCAPPTVTGPRPVPGSAIRDRTPRVSAIVRDAETDLSKSDVALFVDGKRRYAFSYDAATDGLAFASPRLSYGRHGVRVIARDHHGLVASRTWGFQVVR